jgi:hypothetical protein
MPHRLLRRALLALPVACLVALLLPHAAEARSVLQLPVAIKKARHPGYQLATEAGDVVPFGAATSASGPSGGLASPATGIARTASGAGTWTVTADGGVRTSGDAPFLGSIADTPHHGRAVAIAATTTGRGYWLLTSDGGVFAFGDAPFLGSAAGTALHAPAVALVATPTGRGYWLATADGGVQTFGDAPFFGARAGDAVVGWITAMAATPTGRGYWLLAVDGGVFTFGDARFHGRPAPGDASGALVGIASTATGRGYWLAAADGGVFAYGDARFLGSAAGKVWGDVIGIAAGAGRKVASAPQAAAPRLRSTWGNDISWPQCSTDVPEPGYGFGIIGVTGGRPFTVNPCLNRLWRWATTPGTGAGVYVNLASAVPGGRAEMHGPAGDCSITDLPCQTYNQAANTIGAALAVARQHGITAPLWWLDVEVANRWSGSHALNTLTVRAAAETLAKAGIRAGVYSTPLMWKMITGGARLDLPAWVAGGTDDAGAPALCGSKRADFTGGGVWLVQSLPVLFDNNVACRPLIDDPGKVFHFSS